MKTSKQNQNQLQYINGRENQSGNTEDNPQTRSTEGTRHGMKTSKQNQNRTNK